jgi:hypothetical protein
VATASSIAASASATVVDASAADRAPALNVPPVAALLRDGFEARFVERALPYAGLGRAPPRVVVDQSPGRTRIIFDDPSLRVLLWTENTKLWPTPLRVTPLTRQPVKAGPNERVRVGPGAFLQRLNDKGDLARVSASDRTFEAVGWLPISAIGHAYLPSPIPEAPGTEEWVLAPLSNVLERPGGSALGKLVDTAPPQVRVGTVAKSAAWFVEIAYGSATLSVRGFVPKSALSQPQSMGWGSGGFGYGARKNPPEETLTFPRGACLYSEPWGEVIGVLRHPLNRTVHVEIGDTAAWRELDLRWADARVWVPREGATAERPAGAVESLSLENGFSCRPAPTR